MQKGPKLTPSCIKRTNDENDGGPRGLGQSFESTPSPSLALTVRYAAQKLIAPRVWQVPCNFDTPLEMASLPSHAESLVTKRTLQGTRVVVHARSAA